MEHPPRTHLLTSRVHRRPGRGNPPGRCRFNQRCGLPPAALLLLLAALPPHLHAQVYGTDAHTVTVQVLPITVIGLSGGLVQLDVTAAQAEAGQDLMTVTDESTRLLWGTNSSGRKVTAASSLAAPRYTLLLRAVAPTRGLAAPEFPLDAVPRDLLLNVGRSTGSCALRYTGVARASQGTGTDTHVITFTIQSQ